MSKKKFSKQYLTPEQARKISGFKSIWTIYRHIKSGKLKAIKLTPKSFLIEKKELQKFLKKYKTK